MVRAFICFFSFIFVSQNFVDAAVSVPGPSELMVNLLPRQSRQEIRLIMADQMPVTYKVNGSTLTINFNAPIQAKNLFMLMQQTKGWVKDVRQNDASSYSLVARPDITFDVKQLERTLIINLLEGYKGDPARDPQIVIEDTPTHGEVTLIWPELVDVKHELTDETYIFSLSKPIKNEAIGELWKTVPRWVSETTNFYDNFSLKVAKDVVMKIEKMGPQLILSFAYEEKHIDLVKQTTPTPTTPGIRLDRYKGQTLLNSDQDFQARAQFSDIVGRTPENLDAMEWLGDTEAHIKRWRRAILVYDHMFALDPQETGVSFRKAMLLHENGTYLEFDPEWYKVEGAETTLVGRTSGRYILGTHDHLEGVVEERHICGADYNNQFGETSIYKGYRTQGHVFYVHAFDSLDKLHVGLFGSNYTVGGALAYTFGWKHAETRFGVNYHTTDWNYIQQIVDGGNVDSVGFKHEHRFLKDRLFADVVVDYNKFNLRFKDDVGRSTRVNATLNYNLIDRNEPTLTIGYGLSGEYVHKVKKGKDATGTEFPFVPLVDREAHSLVLRSGMYLTDYIHTEAVFGYSYERYSHNSGPIMGLAFLYEPIPHFTLGLRGNREILNSRGSNRFLNSVMGSITVRF